VLPADRSRTRIEILPEEVAVNLLLLITLRCYLAVLATFILEKIAFFQWLRSRIEIEQQQGPSTKTQEARAKPA
jgi:hypothetical protein